MTTEQLQETRKLADEISEYVRKGSSEPIYTTTVIDKFAVKKADRTKVKLTLWDMIAGKLIHVGDNYQLTVTE